MGFMKKIGLFSLGGAAYMGVELLWRGRSHGSMFLVGGTGFLLLGQARKRYKSPLSRAVISAGVITGVELAAGLVFNRDHKVWDYRGLPGHFLGQICVPYAFLWTPLGLAAMELYHLLDPQTES